MENELVVICALIISCLVVATDCLRAICNRLRTLLKSGFFLSLSLHRRASRKVDDGEEPLLGSLFLFQSLIFWPPISIFRRAMSYLKNDKEGMD